MLHCHIPEHLTYCEYISQTSLITKQNNQNVHPKHANQNVQVESCKRIQTCNLKRCNQNVQVKSFKQIQTCNQIMQANPNMQSKHAIKTCKLNHASKSKHAIKTFKLNHASTSKHAMIAYFFLACFSCHHICALCMLLAQVFNFDSTLLDLPAFPLHTLPWCEPTLKHGSTTCLDLLSLKFCQLVVCFAWNLGKKQLKDCSWQVVLCKCILCKSLRSSTKGHGRLRRGRGSGRLKTVESIGTQSALGKC